MRRSPSRISRVNPVSVEAVRRGRGGGPALPERRVCAGKANAWAPIYINSTISIVRARTGPVNRRQPDKTMAMREPAQERAGLGIRGYNPRHMSKEGGRAVLVVEDDVSVRRPLVKFLEMHGFAVATAETADEGLDALKKQKFTAAVVDLRLKRGSGRDVVVSAPADNARRKLCSELAKS